MTVTINDHLRDYISKFDPKAISSRVGRHRIINNCKAMMDDDGDRVSEKQINDMIDQRIEFQWLDEALTNGLAERWLDEFLSDAPPYREVYLWVYPEDESWSIAPDEYQTGYKLLTGGTEYFDEELSHEELREELHRQLLMGIDFAKEQWGRIRNPE